LYLSHGWSGVLDREASGHVDSVWKFPCNKDVLDSANGVIVHSLHSKALAESWYGSKYSERWASIPLIRELSGTRDRERARQTLGLPVGAFITCSFGLLGPTKMNDQLLKAWLDSPLGLNESCYLIFVGENDKGTYGRELEDSISKCPAKHRIRITGFVTHEHYRNFLCACDSAVQLRRQSRGETSAAILDCLLYGVPTISNAHGAGVELPDSVVVMLEDAFSNRSLSAALTQLWEDAELRHRLSGLAQEHVQSKHNPTLVGELYHQSIEQMVIQSSSLRYRRLLNALGRIDSRDKNSDDDIIACAKAIAANTPVSGQRQLLVDVSAMVQTDLRTGIQRVVRSILSAFLLEPPSNFRVEPVFTMGAGEPYRYARSYMQRAFSLPTVGFLDDPIEVRFGDRFLGLDLFLEGTHRNESVLQDFRNRGVEIFFVVFDILPLLQPSWFPKGVDADFKCWLNAVSNVSDGLLCISRSVSDDLCKWLSQHSPKGIEPLGLGHFRLGADIRASAPSKGLLDDADNLFVRMSLRPSVLMVGTLEPRKGHAQALSAFELLWNSGVDVNLVIVGKHGWLVDSLVERIELHRERGSRLFWIHGASDETLLKIYAGSSGLLAASEGEGFGLPLVEAALHNLPILARDLPVFREVAGDHAYYFVGLTAQSLAESLTVWLSLLNESCAPVWNDFTWLTWAQSAREMLDLMETRDWDHVVPKHLPKLDLYGTT
jgi:glycosyltransferase involved in cell wall biosynthesis